MFVIFVCVAIVPLVLVPSLQPPVSFALPFLPGSVGNWVTHRLLAVGRSVLTIPVPRLLHPSVEVVAMADTSPQTYPVKVVDD